MDVGEEGVGVGVMVMVTVMTKVMAMVMVGGEYVAIPHLHWLQHGG